MISHGSSKRDWIQEVDEAVQAVRTPPSIPVISSFLEMVEGRLVQDGIDQLEAEGVEEIIVIPLFISSGSTHIEEIRWALGLTNEPAIEPDLSRYRCNASITFGKPIDDDPIIGHILLKKLLPLSENRESETLLLIGHGTDVPGFHEKWREGLERLANRIRTLGQFAAAEGAMLLPDEVALKMKELRRLYPDFEPIVVPLFLSEGYFTGTVIPRRLSGFEYRYNGKALLPSPHISHWMEQQIHDLLSSN